LKIFRDGTKLENVQGSLLLSADNAQPMVKTSRDTKKMESEEGEITSEEISSTDHEETFQQKDSEETASVLEEILGDMTLADENVKNDSENHKMDKILFLN